MVATLDHGEPDVVLENASRSSCVGPTRHSTGLVMVNWMESGGIVCLGGAMGMVHADPDLDVHGDGGPDLTAS